MLFGFQTFFCSKVGTGLIRSSWVATLKFAVALLFTTLLVPCSQSAGAQAVSFYSFPGIYSSAFGATSGVAPGGSGRIYAAVPTADGGPGVVVMYQAPNGPSSSYSQQKVGSGFTTPVAVAVDGSGNVFVADQGSNAIYEIVASDGWVWDTSTVNKLASGFTSVSGVAVDGSGNVYVTDKGANKLYELVASNGVVSINTTPLLLASGFNVPVGLAVDSIGNVYIADSVANQVEKIPASDISPIVAGTKPAITILTSYNLSAPSGGWGNPAGVVVDQNDNVFASNAVGTLYRMIAGSGSVQTLATEFNSRSLAIDNKGDILFTRTPADAAIGVIATRVVDLQSQSPAFVTFTFNSTTTLSNIAFLTGGLSNKDFQAYSSSPGTCTTGVEYGPDGTKTCTVRVVFSTTNVGLHTGAVVLSSSSGVVATANLSGVGQGLLVTVDSLDSPNITASIPMTNASSVSVDAAGNQWVGSYSENSLYKIPAGTTTATQVTLPSSLGRPQASAFDASGNMYLIAGYDVVFIPYQGGALHFTALTTIATSWLTVNNEPLGYPVALAVGPEGTVYIAYLSGSKVIAYTPSTGQFRVGAASGLQFPLGLALDATGKLYVVDRVGGVLVYSGSNLINTISLSTLNAHGIKSPSSIAVDASGSVLVGGEDGVGNIIRIPFMNGSLNLDSTLLIAKNPVNSYGIALDVLGNLYVINNDQFGAFNTYSRTSASLNFTGYAGNSTPAKTVYVENSGTIDTQFKTPKITAPSTGYFAVTSPSESGCSDGSTFSLGSVCKVSAIYTPTSVTTKAQTDLASVDFSTGGVASAKINLSGTATLDFTPVSVTVGTSPSSGPTITLDGGTPFSGSQTLQWIPYSMYSLVAQATEFVAGAQYTFVNWTGSTISTELFQTVEATPYSNGNAYMANFSTAYQLNISPNIQAGGTVLPETGHFSGAGTAWQIIATPNPGYVFVNWTGNPELESPTSADTYIIMDRPQTITANFAAILPAASLIVSYPKTVYAGFPAAGTVTALDVNGNPTTSFNGTVTVTTSESTLGISVTLTNGIGSFSATFATAATGQSITASYSGLTSTPATDITVTALPSFVVNTTADDTTDPSPATGETNCPADSSTTGAGSCTLRDALAAASNNGGAITFDATVFAEAETITLGSLGTLNVPTLTSITGPTTGSGSTLTNLVSVDGGNQQGEGVSYTIFTTGAARSPMAQPNAAHAFRSNSAQPAASRPIAVVAAISNLNIQNGNGGLDGYGVGGESGGAGGINNYGALTVTHCTLNANTGTDAGAIYNWNGQLTVNASTFTNNTSTGGWTYSEGDWYGDAGAIFNDDFAPGKSGGGMYKGARALATGRTHRSGHLSRASVSKTALPNITPNIALSIAGSLTVSNSSFTGNSGVYTGGIYNYSQATVTNSTFGGTGAGAGNKSSGDGNGNPDAGALVNDTDSSPAQATVTNSTFTNNSGSVSGAVVNVDNSEGGATLRVGYSTFVGNSSSGDISGGYDAGAIVSKWGARTQVANTTFFNNSSSSGSGAGALANIEYATFEIYGGTITGNSGYFGGIFGDFETSTNLLNSIVSGNTTTDPTAEDDNIAADNNGFFYKPNQGNIVGPSAIALAPLGNYGGPTQTMIPLPGSTAICAGAFRMLKSVYNNTGATLTTDQRGEPNTNASYPGYTTEAPCLDAGAVQTNYAIAYTVPIPSSVTVDLAITPAPVVQLTESGTVLPSASVATSPITISDSATPSVLGGSKTANLSVGLATFNGLFFDSVTSSDTLTATLALNSSLTPALNLTLTSTVSAAAPTIIVSPSTLPGGSVKTSYTSTISAGGGTAPYTFAVTVGTLPTGLTLSSTGLLSGTPTVDGPFSFTVEATDSNSYTGIQAYSVTIAAFVVPTITVSPATLPGGSVKTSYTSTISAGGGTAPYTYAVTVGTLPTGLTLSSAGLLSGNPTVSGPFSFTVEATDSNSYTGIQAYSVTIAAVDFTINATTAAATVMPGGSGVFTFTVAPIVGSTFPAAVTFTATGLPAGATAIFSPASLASGAGSTTVTMTIQTSLTASAMQPNANRNLASRLAPFSLALLLLPFFGRLRRAAKRFSRMLVLLLLVGAGLAAMAGLSGCGSRVGFFGQTQKTYTVGVTATSGTLSHTANVTLTVE